MSAGARVRFAVVPGCLALLPEYAGLADPVPGERAASVAAVADLGSAAVVAGAQGERVGRHLLAAAGHAALDDPTTAGALLVVANGSAKRTEKAPGHLDARAEAFDADLVARLRSGDLADLDTALAAELWADVEPLVRLAELVEVDPGSVVVDLVSDSYGVLYLVARGEGRRR